VYTTRKHDQVYIVLFCNFCFFFCFIIQLSLIWIVLEFNNLGQEVINIGGYYKHRYRHEKCDFYCVWILNFLNWPQNFCNFMNFSKLKRLGLVILRTKHNFNKNHVKWKNINWMFQYDDLI
jgi:hypothetical protein